MITKTTIEKGSLFYEGGKVAKGWCFSVYFNGKKYPNIISALYKTKKEIKEQLSRYIKTGKYDLYGTAEK